MRPYRDERAPSERARPQLSKLFRVLVVGGAALAMASALTIRGSTGAPAPDRPQGTEDGGTPGW
jgi:hypothetical protein